MWKTFSLVFVIICDSFQIQSWKVICLLHLLTVVDMEEFKTEDW